MQHSQLRAQRLVAAVLVPLAIDGVLLRLIPDGALLIWMFAAGAGFVLLTKGVDDRRRGIAALIYFPLMILLFIVAGTLHPWFTFRIHE